MGSVGRIQAGRNASDSTGHELGTIARIYRPDPLIDDEAMGIRTGFLGLGKRLHVPFTAMRVVTREHVFLAQTRISVTGRNRHATPMESPTSVSPTTEAGRRRQADGWRDIATRPYAEVAQRLARRTPSGSSAARPRASPPTRRVPR